MASSWLCLRGSGVVGERRYAKMKARGSQPRDKPAPGSPHVVSRNSAEGLGHSVVSSAGERHGSQWIRGATMVRALTVFMVSLGASVAFAQQDLVKNRKALMKDNADQAKIGAAMIKGQEPFDLVKAQKI